jgi:hypothetical protein
MSDGLCWRCRDELAEIGEEFLEHLTCDHEPKECQHLRAFQDICSDCGTILPTKKPPCWCEVESVFNEKSSVHIGMMKWKIVHCPVCGRKLEESEKG